MRSRALTTLGAAALLGLGACGTDDVEQSGRDAAKQGQDAAQDAGKKAEEAAKDARRKAEEAAEKAKEKTGGGY